MSKIIGRTKNQQTELGNAVADLLLNQRPMVAASAIDVVIALLVRKVRSRPSPAAEPIVAI